ncbi:MAG: S1 RNA-binding domain-containing protein [Spirochaetes bacterium]|nr:S1 RNA-binding domain-containing protein [Spirochaetota bacterium]
MAHINSNENSHEENFSQLLEQSFIKSDNFAVGDSVKGKVILITGDSIFVDIQSKSEAVIDIKEFIDDKGNHSLKVGDTITAYIAAIKRGEIVLTSTIGKGIVSPELLHTAYRNQLPVFGTVKHTTNGGFIVSIGGIQAFCPLSQIDTKVVETESYLNKSFEFAIMRYEQQGKNIILSRRSLLEKIKEETIEKLKLQLKVGDIVQATVVQVLDAGLLASVQSLDAFVPKSELSHSRKPNLNQFETGQTITAKIIDIDWNKAKMTLSIKQTLPQPWDYVNKFEVGGIYTGAIAKIIKSGAFVELSNGLEGFIPVSRMSYVKKIHDPHEVCNEGDSVQVKIIDIDHANKKIALELITGEENPWLAANDSLRDAVHNATIEEITAKGLVVVLPNQMRAFVPREYCAVEKNAELAKSYQAGNTIKVAVVTVNADDRRCIASEKKAQEIEERLSYEQFMASQSSRGSSAFGQLLKQKYEELQKKSKNT